MEKRRSEIVRWQGNGTINRITIHYFCLFETSKCFAYQNSHLRFSYRVISGSITLPGIPVQSALFQYNFHGEAQAKNYVMNYDG